MESKDIKTIKDDTYDADDEEEEEDKIDEIDVPTEKCQDIDKNIQLKNCDISRGVDKLMTRGSDTDLNFDVDSTEFEDLSENSEQYRSSPSTFVDVLSSDVKPTSSKKSNFKFLNPTLSKLSTDFHDYGHGTKKSLVVPCQRAVETEIHASKDKPFSPKTPEAMVLPEVLCFGEREYGTRIWDVKYST